MFSLYNCINFSSPFQVLKAIQYTKAYNIIYAVLFSHAGIARSPALLTRKDKKKRTPQKSDAPPENVSHSSLTPSRYLSCVGSLHARDYLYRLDCVLFFFFAVFCTMPVYALPGQIIGVAARNFAIFFARLPPLCSPFRSERNSLTDTSSHSSDFLLFNHRLSAHFLSWKVSEHRTYVKHLIDRIIDFSQSKEIARLRAASVSQVRQTCVNNRARNRRPNARIHRAQSLRLRRRASSFRFQLNSPAKWPRIDRSVQVFPSSRVSLFVLHRRH